MSDIVRLEENGVPQYIQTVPQAIIGFEKAAKSVTKISPSGALEFGKIWTLTESITEFNDIFVVWSYLGNRGMSMSPTSTNIEFRYSGVNLADAPTSAAFQLSETVAAITNGKTLKMTSSKMVDNAGKITISFADVLIVEVYGVNRK